MRALALAAAGVLALGACSADPRPAAAPSSSASVASVASSSAPTAPPPPTTVSPLVPIEGCGDPGPLAVPDPRRPTYTATATVDMTRGQVDGTVTVTFAPDIATGELVLRVWPNAPIPAASGVHEDIGPVTDGAGQVLTVEQPDATTAHVALPTPLGSGQSITVSVPYSLSIPGGSPERVAHDGDTMRLGSFLPLLAWEPGVGWDTEPATAIHGEAATSPVADYDIAFTLPAGYDILGSGIDDGERHFHAMAVRDVAYSIGHFATAADDVDGIHVTVGVDASVHEDPHVQLGYITDALHAYAGRFGAYSWPTYTVAVTPGFEGGIEFPTHVMQAPGSAVRSFVHEAAHQWFYSTVGNDQARDPWLDEALASYAEFVQVGSLERHAGDAIPADARGRAGAPVTYWEHHRTSYYAGVYSQGAEAVASLGTVDQVDCALRQYVARNAFRVASPADFFVAVSMVFPDAGSRLAPYGLTP